jgi:flagellar FliJ protein
VSFKFRLQRILELREQAEQAKARALAAAQAEADKAQEAKDILAAMRSDSRSQLESATVSSPRIGHLMQLGAAIDALDARLERADDDLKAAEIVVDEAKARLEVAARDRRVLDRLKDRHAEHWRAEEAQKDRLLMDEVALMQFARKTDTNNQDSQS